MAEEASPNMPLGITQVQVATTVVLAAGELLEFLVYKYRCVYNHIWSEMKGLLNFTHVRFFISVNVSARRVLATSPLQFASFSFEIEHTNLA